MIRIETDKRGEKLWLCFKLIKEGGGNGGHIHCQVPPRPPPKKISITSKKKIVDHLQKKFSTSPKKKIVDHLKKKLLTTPKKENSCLSFCSFLIYHHQFLQSPESPEKNIFCLMTQNKLCWNTKFSKLVMISILLYSHLWFYCFEFDI